MRVICIDAKSHPDAIDVCDLVEGESYTVIDCIPKSLNKFGLIEDRPVYILQEKDHRFGYCCSRFIPLSDIDELELINEKQEVYA